MLPKWHILIAFFIFLVLFPFFSWYSLVISLSSVLIDTDHYIISCIKRKSLSLSKAYTYLKNLDKKQSNKNFKAKYCFFLMIFHTYEFLFLLFLLSYSHNLFLFILSGFLIHLAADLISIFATYPRRYFFLCLKSLSLMYHIYTRNKKSFGEFYSK